MAGTFAAFLLGHDYVTAAELEEATQATVLYGGRLGTALIELGLLSPDELDRALSQFHDLPESAKEWLAKPDAAARAALHVDLVKRHGAFPLHFEKRTLHLGMLDPRNEAVLDELAFASGCVIAPHALAEYRFVHLLNRVYGIAPSARFRILLQEAERARQMRKRQKPRAPTAADEDTDTLAIGPLAADLELTDEASFAVLSNAKAAPSAPAAKPLESPALTANSAARTAAKAPEPAVDDTPAARARSVAALEQCLAESTERSEVIDASIALAARFADTAALFVLRDGMASGIQCVRSSAAVDVESTVIPVSGDGLLAACVRERKPVQSAPAVALDKLLAKALRCDDGAPLAAFPIAIGERVINLLVAQAGGGTLPKTTEAALAALAQLLGGAYERLIRHQKQKAMAGALEQAAPEPPKKAAIGAIPLKRIALRKSD